MSELLIEGWWWERQFLVVLFASKSQREPKGHERKPEQKNNQVQRPLIFFTPTPALAPTDDARREGAPEFFLLHRRCHLTLLLRGLDSSIFEDEAVEEHLSLAFHFAADAESGARASAARRKAMLLSFPFFFFFFFRKRRRSPKNRWRNFSLRIPLSLAPQSLPTSARSLGFENADLSASSDHGFACASRAVAAPLTRVAAASTALEGAAVACCWPPPGAGTGSSPSAAMAVYLA